MNTVAPLRPAGSDMPEQDTYRLPPHNLEAEQALLGAILTNNDACDRVTTFLLPEHFFEAVHARIFDAASNMIKGTTTTPDYAGVPTGLGSPRAGTWLQAMAGL